LVPGTFDFSSESFDSLVPGTFDFSSDSLVPGTFDFSSVPGTDVVGTRRQPVATGGSISVYVKRLA
jgi:hypothetical protein